MDSAEKRSAEVVQSKSVQNERVQKNQSSLRSIGKTGK